MSVRKVSHQDTWAVRNEILRPGLPVSTCQFAEDQLQGAVHFSFYDMGQQTGVVSAYPVEFPADNSLPNCWQLRAMATLEAARGKGHGKALVNALEDYLSQQSAQWLWCNARNTAQGFYLKLGFLVVGDEFDIPRIGPHHMMLKALGQSGESE